MSDDKNAFRVNETLVNVEGVLYPITHNFIVKEVEKESEQSDSFHDSHSVLKT